MFEIGDYVIYGGNGVCMVKKIGTLDTLSRVKEKIYYTLEPLYVKGSVFYTPVDNKKVIMRKVISKEETNRLIDEIPNIELIRIENDKVREVELKEAMQRRECKEWVRIIKTLYLRKKNRIAQGKKITATDEKYLKQAEEQLFGELAIPLEMDKSEVENFIIEKVLAASKK